MKKIFVGLCALVMCFMVAACGSKTGADKVNALIEDCQKNAKSWNAEQWETFLVDMYSTQVEIAKNVKDEAGYKEFKALSDKAEEALNAAEKEADETAMTAAFMKLMSNEQFLKIADEGEKIDAELKKKYEPEAAEAEEEEEVEEEEVAETDSVTVEE